LAPFAAALARLDAHAAVVAWVCSTIIMPCNSTGYTQAGTTLGWGTVDFDWSNGKGTGTADGWARTTSHER